MFSQIGGVCLTAKLSRLVEDGKLQPHGASTFTLEDAAEAHRFLATSAIGKVVLEV